MDHMCDYGVTDLSMFTFFEIVGKADPLGVRYMEALSYFRTGRKGLILNGSAAVGAPL